MSRQDRPDGLVSRICLGTAQFGMEYGIANDRGRVPAAEVVRILDLAAGSGVDSIDTAVAYGESEATLGSADLSAFRVITKLLPIPADEPDLVAWVADQTRASCGRLGLDRLHGLMLHAVDDLRGPRGSELSVALRATREAGLTDGIGVSIYAPSQLEGIDLEELDLVQAPLNVFDRRLIDSGALSALNDAGVEVYARSALLQGVLVMDPGALPPRLAGLRAPVLRFQEWAAEREVSPVAAALGHLFAIDAVHRVVLGVDGLDHLRGALQAEAENAGMTPPELAVDDLDLIDPRRWS